MYFDVIEQQVLLSKAHTKLKEHKWQDPAGFCAMNTQSIELNITQNVAWNIWLNIVQNILHDILQSIVQCKYKTQCCLFH